MSRRILFVAIASGFSGMIVQLLLLRELLTVFHGNDLSIGIILANWLALEAFGSFFIGKKIETVTLKVRGYIILALLFVLVSPLSLYLTRILRCVIGVMPGVGIGVLSIFYSSLLVLFLPSILHGALFVFTCKLAVQFSNFPLGNQSNQTQKGAFFVGKIYVWETVGHIVGALTFTFLLIPHFHSFTIILGAGVIILVASLFFTATKYKKIFIDQRGLLLLAATLVFFTGLIAGGGDDRLHWLSVERQWLGQEVVHHQHSVYGNVTVIERGGEYTFLSDGIPVFTTPTPDIVFVEEFVHFSMLSHPQPENIAVLTGGAGGVINEILKHPTVKRVDYTEIDPLLLEVVRKFPTSLTETELNDPRVDTHYLDGRRFLKLTPHQYDLIFVGISNPENLQANRFFTAEFFSLANERLREGGILVVALPSSLTYLSPELKDLNAVIINTLRNTFPHLWVIPGYFNMFLASTFDDVTLVDATLLYERMQERKLDLRLITLPHIELKLSQRRLDWFWESLQGATTELNQDFRPMGFFYSLTYWNAMFSPYLRRFFAWLDYLTLKTVAIVIFLFTIFILVIREKFTSLTKESIPFSLATTGFAGMVFDITLIFTFQALFGFVFHWIGILVAAFMVGIAIGGFLITRFLNRIKNDLALFIKLEISIIFFAIALPLILFAIVPYLENPTMFFVAQGLFLLLAFIAGVLVGLKFPLANKIYLAHSSNLSRTAGLLYGVDLFGGWIGGILGAVVLLPVLGLLGSSLVVAMVKASSLIVLVSAKKELLL